MPDRWSTRRRRRPSRRDARPNPFKQGGNISLSDRWGEIDYNAGIDMERDTSGWYGTEYLYDEDGTLLESGPDTSTEKGFRVNSVSFNASTWLGDNRVQLNSRLTTNNSDYHRPTASIPVSPDDPLREVIIHTRRLNLSYELGTDVERTLFPGLDGLSAWLRRAPDHAPVFASPPRCGRRHAARRARRRR